MSLRQQTGAPKPPLCLAPLLKWLVFRLLLDKKSVSELISKYFAEPLVMKRISF